VASKPIQRREFLSEGFQFRRGRGKTQKRGKQVNGMHEGTKGRNGVSRCPGVQLDMGCGKESVNGPNPNNSKGNHLIRSKKPDCRLAKFLLGENTGRQLDMPFTKRRNTLVRPGKGAGGEKCDG